MGLLEPSVEAASVVAGDVGVEGPDVEGPKFIEEIGIGKAFGKDVEVPWIPMRVEVIFLEVVF